MSGWRLFLLASLGWAVPFVALGLFLGMELAHAFMLAGFTYAIPFGGAWCACVLSWKLF